MIRLKRTSYALLAFGVAGFASAALALPSPAQDAPIAHVEPVAASPLDWEGGISAYDTPDFTLKLVNASQTIAALQPKGAGGFDFTPADWLAKRSANGFHHLGDLTFRVRSAPYTANTIPPWQSYDTAADRHPVTPLPIHGSALAAADLTPTLPADCPLQVTRIWSVENKRLALSFIVKNTTKNPVEIGALGIPLVFNNILTDRDLPQAHAVCSFSDPYIGLDAGYVQVTRLSGEGPAMLVVPESKTPFEAYRPLDEPDGNSQVAEGQFAWMAHSAAYAENEWKNATPWNAPTSEIIAPGATRMFGIEFLLSPTIPSIDKTLEAAGHPVAIGIPGYVLPKDQTGKLFLDYRRRVQAIAASPAGSIAFTRNKNTATGWQSFDLHGKIWGRSRLTITYADGLKQSINYYVIKPEAQAVADLGRFLTTKQWFVDPSDPFHRSPSVISYDYDHHRQITQESRVWIAGLGDEAGSGSWLAAAMKEFGDPNPLEVAKYDEFVTQTLWGTIQYKDGPNKYGVKKSTFYHDPAALPNYPYDKSIDWGGWTSWNKRDAYDYGRGYDYPHVVAAYWAMYRVARNHPGMVKSHPWNWYLNQAYQTTKFAFSRDANGNRRVGYVELGLMDGDVFLQLLKDLQREGWTAQADDVTALMKERADLWKTEQFPFGSEMPWDSTGQEEVYAWCKYFGYNDKADVALDSIIGYMPTLPNWAYNGNARRYWDFIFGGAPGGTIERMGHHYGSGLNAIPVLSEYRSHPDEFYLLQVGYGGTIGPLTNINQEGFASTGFHTYPDALRWDGYSGDYGPNFFGHALDTATYIIDHPDFGWQSYGGNVSTAGQYVTITPRDDFRIRVYVAPYGLWLTLTAGKFQTIQIDTKTHSVRIGFAPASKYTPVARLMVEQPAPISGIGTYQSVQRLTAQRGAYVIPLGAGTTWVNFVANPRKAGSH